MKNRHNIESNPGHSAPDIRPSKVSLLPIANQTSGVGHLIQWLLPRGVLSKSKTLLFAWLLALAGTTQILFSLQHQSTHFFGLVDGKEQSVSFQYPVEIVSLPVVEGQQISAGRQILKVKRNDLTSQIDMLEAQINETYLKHQEYLATTAAAIKTLKAEQSTKSAELDRKIKRLMTRYQLNMELNSSIVNSKVPAKGKSNLLFQELESLKSSRHHTYRGYQAKIDNLQSQLKLKARPANAKISNLEKQKLELIRQQSSLNVAAKFDGNIGSILFKPGETVEPYKPVLTIHSSYQNIVKGYIHESLINDVAINQTVWVKPISKNQSDTVVEGKVKSLGKRIIAYPERLKRNSNISAFGREVIIELQQENPLLLSEKVIVLLQAERPLYLLDNIKRLVSKLSLFGIGDTKAAGNNSTANDIVISLEKQTNLNPIVSQIENIEAQNIEASGIIQNKHSNNFLLISDESDKKHPALYEMNLSGEITSVHKLQNIKNIDDMESISQDDQYIYLLTSLSVNKSGKHKKRRNRFVRLKPLKNDFRVNDELDFNLILKRLSESDNTSPKLSSLISTALKNKEIDIEAHAVIDNNLYIGLKKPLGDNGKSIIVKISDLHSIFENKKTSASLWQSIDFNSVSPDQNWQLSDFIMIDEQLFLLTVGDEPNIRSSAFWSFDIANQKLKLKKVFPNHSAEGISKTKTPGTFMIVFDGGGKENSQYYLFNDA